MDKSAPIFWPNSWYLQRANKAKHEHINRIIKQAIARFYIHPNLDVSLNNNVLKIQGLKFSLSANIEDISVSMHDSLWYPQFGQKIPNKVIEINFACKESKILFTWEERLNQWKS